MTTPEIDPRQKTILEASWNAFSIYGFRKTSMDDIARASGMSRPALYLHYRNKEDIYRSLVGYYYTITLAGIEQALTVADNVGAAIDGAFAAQGGPLIEEMLRSPHGLELLDAKAATAADVVADGEQRIAARYEAWLHDWAALGRLSLPDDPRRIAESFGVALKGLKSSGATYPVFCAQLQTLARLFTAALENKETSGARRTARAATSGRKTG